MATALSDLSALRAPRPVPPKLEAGLGDKKVHIILRDMEKIKNSKPSKKLKRCEHLIYFIVHTLRKAPQDHLLHSTSVWVLVTIFRIFPEETKPVMLEAGVPGLLLDIMKLGALSGSSRQYASELCFYLSSNHPYPQDERSSGPMKTLPEVQPLNRYQASLDDISVGSDLSSAPNEGRGKDRFPFVPYRINDVNMAKMDALFEKGYEHELAASLPNANVLSRYGFSDYDPKMMSGQHDDSSDSDVNYDDDDVSTLSSGTRSVSMASHSSSVAGSLAGSFAGSWNVSKQHSKVDLSTSLVSSRLARTAPTSNKRPRALTNAPTAAEVKHKVAKQFNIHAPRRPDDLLQLFDDNDSLALSQDSHHSRRSHTSHQSRTSSAPLRVVQQLRQHNVSASPERVKTTGGLFMADALVTDDNWAAARSGPSKRPLPPRFMMETAQPSAGPTDLQTYLSTLDPLSLAVEAPDTHQNGRSIAQQVFTEEMHWDELMDDQSDHEAEATDDGDGEGLRAGNALENDFEETPLQRAKKMRMKAEKLIDHSFINKFFVHKKPDIPAIQDLLRRSEQLFGLLDKENTGYVTFEAFARLLIAVAPQHILRRDIDVFIQAQTENMQDLVDYHEFIISGKVLLLTKAQALQARAIKSRIASPTKGGLDLQIDSDDGKQVSSTKAWMARQKAITGDASTYTWKAHIEWYQTRKSQALIWLIRRATRALDYEGTLLDAKRWLLTKAKQALAWSYLMEVGRMSLLQKGKANVSRQKLLRRVMHARYFMLKVQQTHEHLKSIALAKNRELDYLDRVRAVKSLAAAEQVRELEALHSRPKQANIGNVFKAHTMQRRAFDYLRALAKKAVVHTSVQQTNLSYLIVYAARVQGQLILKDRARRELIQRAEAAYEFLIKQDQVLLGLLRIGSNALAFFDRQTEALKFLLAKGPAALEFLGTQHTAGVELYEIGQKTLSFMNTREDAFAYLRTRREKSIVFIERKREAVDFLRRMPDKVWRVLDGCNEAQEWLVARARRAVDYGAVRQRAQQYLQFIAGRANSTSRRIAVAREELCQVGLLAKFEGFKLWVKSMPKVQKYVATEYKHIRRVDQATNQQRRGMNAMIRNKIELREAFEILCTVCTPKHILSHKSEIQKLEDLISDQSINALLTKTLGSTFASTLSSSPPKSPERSSAVAGNLAGTMTGTLGSSMELDEGPMSFAIGRVGLRKLLLDGRLLGVDTVAVDEFFRNADIRQTGYISFSDLLPWWREQAEGERELRAHQRSMLHADRAYTLPDILSPMERAFINVYKRVQREQRQAEEDEEDNEYTKFKNRRRGESESGADSDESSDESSDDEMDSDEEENLMSDVKRLQNVDVGKLMRYLTRRRKAVDLTGTAMTEATEGTALPSELQETTPTTGAPQDSGEPVKPEPDSPGDHVASKEVTVFSTDTSVPLKPAT